MKEMNKEEIISKIREIVNSADPAEAFEKALSEYEELCKKESEEYEARLNSLKEKVTGICNDLYPDGYEVYTSSYDEELAYCQPSVLKELFESDDPRFELSCKISDAAFDYGMECGLDNVKKEVMNALSTAELELYAENSEEMFDIIRENIDFFYDEDSFNHNVKVNLLIDCGNANYDYTCDNVLNYCGNGEIDENSSILWLARQQGKEKELRETVSMFMESDGNDESSDSFVKSCITEWNNLISSIGTLTFLTSMRLFELLDLVGVQKKIEKGENKYDSNFIEISKDAMCGLFDPVNGSGSVLEIELDKDVKIPIKNLRICPEGCRMAGYDVNEVYGLVDYAWGDCYK